MAPEIGKASDLLKALANPHRLMILCQLTERECSVGELAGCLDLRLSTISQHLSLLRRDGLVAPRREGQTIHYRLADPVAKGILETLFAAYCAPNSGKLDDSAARTPAVIGKKFGELA